MTLSGSKRVSTQISTPSLRRKAELVCGPICYALTVCLAHRLPQLTLGLQYHNALIVVMVLHDRRAVQGRQRMVAALLERIVRATA